MTEDIYLQQLRDMRYPGDIDVVDAVMEQVRNKPLLVPQPSKTIRLRRIVASVAACAAIVLAINLTHLYTRDYNEAQIGDMMAEVYGFYDDYGSTADYYEMGAVELLYEEDY